MNPYYTFNTNWLLILFNRYQIKTTAIINPLYQVQWSGLDLKIALFSVLSCPPIRYTDPSFSSSKNTHINTCLLYRSNQLCIFVLFWSQAGSFDHQIFFGTTPPSTPGAVIYGVITGRFMGFTRKIIFLQAINSKLIN